jgi:hypothetical protein
MISAGVIGSLVTSAQPAARRTGSRTEGTATMVAATNVTTTRIGTHLDARELMLVPTALGRLRAMLILLREALQASQGSSRRYRHFPERGWTAGAAMRFRG